jgi:hypothetical protein
VTTKTISFKEFFENHPVHQEELLALSPPSQFFTESDMDMIHNAYYFVGGMFIVIYTLLKLEKRFKHKKKPQIADRFDLALRIFIVGMFVVVVWRFVTGISVLIW